MEQLHANETGDARVAGKALIIAVLAVVTAIGIALGGIALSSGTTQEGTLVIAIAPARGDCGTMADVVDEVRKFLDANPARKVKKTEIVTKDRATERCVVSAEIYHEERAKLPPKPATLGAAAESGFMRAAEEGGQVLENFQDGIGYWCKPDTAEAFTEQATKRLLAGFKEKYHATREVITDKIFPSPEGRRTAAYCIFYELKKKAPSRRLGKALAFAGVFILARRASPRFASITMMKILDVVPFARGVPPHALSYFGKDDAAPGAMVSVPLRGKKVKGLVVAARDAAEAKSSVKASRYSLRKIDKVLGMSALSEAFLKSAESAALFFACSLGETIAQTVPEYLQGKLAVATKGAPVTARSDGPVRMAHPGGLKAEKFVLQRELEERLDYLRTYVRTEFAKGASVFLVLPTAEEAEHFAEEVSRGVERFAFVLHGRLPKKELAARLSKLDEETHSVLVVGTPYFLALPRKDIGTVVVEHESSSAYRTVSRPYLDLRVFAEILAANSGWKIIFADTLLQVETLSRHESRELTELLPMKWRIKTREERLIIDTRKKEEGGEGKKKFALISEAAEDAIRDALRRRGSVLVYASRRGLHPVSVCGDCGTTLACPRCSSPLVLHGHGGGGKQRAFICHKCKGAVSAETPCSHCGGWKLVPLGYGTESVEEELAAAFPEEKVLRLDRDSAATPGEARRIAEEFEKKKGGILVGSEMALYYLTKPLDTIIVASIDSLASIPSFRIGEKMFQTLLSLRSRAEREFIVQTRLADKKLLGQLVEGDLINFYRDELRDRRAFNFPPAARLVKLTLEGKQPMLAEEAERLKSLFGKYSPESYNAFISKIKSLYRTHIVLRLPPREWTVPELGEGRLDRGLLGLILALPPEVAVRVMPEDIL